ncbi:MAG: VacJ family lipoprotein [Methylococcales bacterium]|nr:VacJ family lipoprotein [Methylococcales bacterium]
MPIKNPINVISSISISLKVSRAILVMAVTLAGCATTDSAEHAANKDDPYENVNRAMYVFNDKLDDYLAAPVSKVYNKITPQFARTGVFNFFNNLKNINVIVNDALQAKFMQGARDSGRLLLNSTLGLGGFVDVATDTGLDLNIEDFDQTLAVWGVPTGSYLVLPIIGPSTMRGIPGSAFDVAANPSSYLGMPIQLVSLLNTRATAEGALKFIDEASLDPYVFTRESFLQWRNNLATDGKSESSMDFGDDLDELNSGANEVSAKGPSALRDDTKAKHKLELSAPLQK